MHFAVCMAEKTAFIAQILRPMHLNATVGFEACYRRLLNANTVIASDELKQRLPVDTIIKFSQLLAIAELVGFGDRSASGNRELPTTTTPGTPIQHI